ncbi:MAG: hypothetical protein ACOYEG_01480 [Petrimonas sp.]|jgi:hypothetical protein|nr:MAG: hypothetical protein BWZ00_00875 [Bacteroidetes bacterium ADurb.BinA174]
MNSKKLSIFFLFSVILWCNISCDTQDEPFLSIKEFTVEGEGGKTVVKINNTDWFISKVVNTNGNLRISGEVFSSDGTLLQENSFVAMKGEGRIESKWMDKGFIITRNSPNTLTIEVLENSTGEPFNFRIVIQGKNKTEEILVKQKVSEGYSFAGIDYFLQEKDKDSLYYKKGASYQFYITTSGPFSFSPYSGVDIFRQSNFESHDPNAFVWIKDDSIEVNVPQTIIDGKVYLSNKKHVYGVTTKEDYLKENTFMETLNLPAGKSAFHVDQEWQKRVVSYRLTLTNNRTKAEKKVEGKWIETTPTGNYKIVNDE